MRHASRFTALLLAILTLLFSACSPSNITRQVLTTATDTPQSQLSLPAQADSYALPNISEGQVNIREVNGFSDEYNTWYVSGLVSNDTRLTVNQLEIEVQLIDANGSVLYTDTTNTAINNLAAGETSPFILYTYEPLSAVETIAVRLVNSSSTLLERVNLDFSGITLWYDITFNDVYLSGNVTNNTPNPVQVNGIAASLHEADGSLTSANTAYPILSYLEPGISAPFRVVFDVPPGEGAALSNYQLYLDAERTSQVNILDLVTSQEHYGYLDAYDKFHLVGTITNNTEAYYNVHLVAGIFDDAGNCIDAASLYLPIAAAPGETMPYDFDLWGALDSSKEAYKSATQYEIYIDWHATNQAQITPVHIATQDDNSTFDGISASFDGHVLNNSGRTLDSAAVIILLFDRTTGEMIATDYTYVSGPIEDGGTVPYAVYLYPQADFDPGNVEFSITAFGQ